MRRMRTLAAILDSDRHDRLAGDATARCAGPPRADVALVDLDRVGEELAPPGGRLCRASLTVAMDE